MADVGDLLRILAVDLNDAAPGHENVAWGKEQLRAYLLEAFHLIGEARPGLFARIKVLSFVGSQEYYEVCPCDSLGEDGVLGQSDASGNVFQSVKARPFGPAGRWPGRSCPPDPASYRIREFTVTPDGKYVKFYPSVPPGLEVHVAVRCSAIGAEDGNSVPDEAAAAAVQWALYRAKMVDGENNPHIAAVAAKHQESFLLLMGLGARGSRRPRAAAPSGAQP